jgi:outer membrane protein TolC
MRLLFFTALAAAVNLPLLGEVRTLTLRDALDIAVQQNPDVVLARYDELKAQHAVREARDPFYPKVFVGSGLAYSSGFPLSIEGSAPSIVRADAVQTFFNREKSYLLAGARERARGAAIDRESKADESAWTVAAAFLELERVTRAVRVAEDQSGSLTRASESTRARVDGGRELEVEAKKVLARAAQARHRAAGLRTEMEYQESSLAVLLGFPAEDRVRPAMEQRVLTAPVASGEEAEDRAVAASKTLQGLESRLTSAGLDRKASEAARLPRVDLVAQYGLFARFNNFEDFFQKFQRNNAQLGVSIQVPVVPSQAAIARREQADTDAARLRAQIEQVRNRVRLDARRAWQDAATAESLREVARLDLEAAREQVSVLMAQFAEGRATLRQVEEGRFIEQEKWIAYLDAENGADRMVLALLWRTGELRAALQ